MRLFSPLPTVAKRPPTGRIGDTAHSNATTRPIAILFPAFPQSTTSTRHRRQEAERKKNISLLTIFALEIDGGVVYTNVHIDNVVSHSV